MANTIWIRVAALLAFAGVALGAFGAHGLKETLAHHNTHAIWETGAFYHLLHAVAMMALAGHANPRHGPQICFLTGVLLFSGSLYILAITGLRWLGAVTPLGGVAFLVGWVWVMVPKPGSPRDPA